MPLMIQVFYPQHHIYQSFENFFWTKYPQTASFLPETLFSLEEANDIAQHVPEIKSPQDILTDIRGSPVDGQLELLYELVVHFQKGDVFHNHLIDLEEKRKQLEIEKKKKRQEARAKANQKSDEQIAEETARVAEKRAAAAMEEEMKFIAAAKRKSDAIKHKEEAERKKEAKKRKWEEDKIHLEFFKRRALEAGPSTSTSQAVSKPVPLSSNPKRKPKKAVLTSSIP
ncbi:hypothetical protein PtB15_4B79 [Puccinia triticina]|nr:hypothetical protein PtB15_4B79 [Puccinia triticina]